jgi:hypothetical protein
MKGNISIFIIIGIVVVAITIFGVYRLFQGEMITKSPPPAGYQNLSEDPKYKDVKEKYNLSEEQLQILSTVNPEDNE